jgi:DNA polymerase-3 subunit gamma/tau
VSRDEATVKLLETSPSIRQRYREQAVRAPLSFLYDSLDIGSNCMLNFRSSKNQRLHVELALLRMCNLPEEKTAAEPKKKTERHPDATEPEIKLSDHSPAAAASPVIKPGPAASPPKNAQGAEEEKKISIKNIVAGSRPAENIVNEPLPDTLGVAEARDFTNEELQEAWNVFAAEVKEASPRISVTLSAVSPLLMPDKTIILKLDNSTLKETFDHNFRARLENHLRLTLKNSTVKLQTTVEATERGEILYSSEQKFNHLASKNPALKDLKKSFNLDFE